jgi:tetratricopeptide (TPR) repeat protein
MNDKQSSDPFPNSSEPELKSSEDRSENPTRESENQLFLQQAPELAPVSGNGVRRRRRSSERDERRGKNYQKRPKQPNETFNSEKIIFWGCLATVGLSLFLLGFYYGQKLVHQPEAEAKSVKSEAEFPLPDSAAQLDAAFVKLAEGKYHEAMEGFQKAQDSQPGLSGIDFLIAESAYKAGDSVTADDSATRAISKDELAGQARILKALITLGKAADQSNDNGPPDGGQLTDPFAAAENELRLYSAEHPEDVKVYALWGDLLRSKGSYASAADMFHKGELRADPEISQPLLSAKEQIARLQNETAKKSPSVSGITAMDAEQALLAAFASLQLHHDEDAAIFFEKAKDLYPPRIFRELTKDAAFDEYRTNSQLKAIFGSGAPVSVPSEPVDK